jgi:hypothetical protein
MGNEKISKMNPRPFADLHPIDRPQKHMTHKRAVREAMRVGYAAQYVGLTDFLKGLYKSDERDYSANVSNTRRYLHSTYSDDAKGAILAIEVQKAISDSYYRARCNGKWPADPAPRVEGKRYKSRPTKLLRRDGKNVYDLPPGTSEDVGARERQKWASASGFKQVYQPKDEATADDYETLLSDLEMGDEEISQQVSDDAQVTELGERGVAEGFTYPPDTLDVRLRPATAPRDARGELRR